MSLSKNTINTMIAGAFAITMYGTAIAPASAMGSDKEKCYGVVKAGKNSCGSADGKHSCMGQATEDGSAVEWIGLPKGLCDKLVGGSTTPVSGKDKGAHEGEMDHDKMNMKHEG